jgi:hypothetical protein
MGLRQARSIRGDARFAVFSTRYGLLVGAPIDASALLQDSLASPRCADAFSEKLFREMSLHEVRILLL